MPETEKEIGEGGAEAEQRPGIDSHFRLIAVAALRSKQLLRGARPRIAADPRKRRNTSIALEEVKRGLIPFTITSQQPDGGAGGGRGEGVIIAE